MNKNESKYFNTAQKFDKALLSLLEKKEFEYITIREICSAAGVNRSTFYLHYENTRDLLKETTKYVLDRFLSYFSADEKSISLDFQNCKIEEIMFITPKYLMPYLSFIKENKRVYKLIHEKPHVFKNQYTSQKWYEQLFTKILDKFGVEESEKEYVFAYFSYGLVAIVQKWIENDCNDSVEAIAKLMKKVIGYES